MPSASRPHPRRPAPPPAHAGYDAAPPKGRDPSPARRDDDDGPLSNLPDDLLPLPPADGDDEPPPPGGDDGLEPALPPGGDVGLDDSLADDLPVGHAIDDLGEHVGDDGSLGLNEGDENDALDDAPPPFGDESEGFEGGEEGGLPDDEGGTRAPDDDGAEGPEGAPVGLDVDSIPGFEPDDEGGPPSELPGLPPLPGDVVRARPPAARAFRSSGPHTLPFAAQALAVLDDGTLAVAGAGLALFGGTPPSPRGVVYPFDEGAPALALCADPFRPGALLLVDRRLDAYAFDASRALASPRPPLPGPPLAGAGTPALFRLEGPRVVAWHPSGLTLSLDAGGHWSRFFHVPFVAFAADGARACAGLAESIEGRSRLHVSTDGGASFGAHDAPPGLGAAPAGTPWLLACHGAIVLLGRPGRGLWASREPGDWKRVPGGEAVLALAPPGAGPLALVGARGRGAALVRADDEGAPIAELPEAFDGPGARLAWDATGRRLWLARGRALMALEPPPS